ncbi:hypothetical protein FBEOM_2235 [Fusarium beomiforme]|uniref:F-box domain-containing protein n=1 Tax=Fusarium beomiforme TaxID=44412 RepID=A0A9P5ASE0_9HYPO|nr:hypothetical protein FBEOM_2235 [Fusarium beomiforme]
MTLEVKVTPGSDIPLPLEIISLICFYASKLDQLRLRLASRQLCQAATPHALKSLYLRAYGRSSENFKNIARSTTLRTFVKEVSIDTWIGPVYEHHANGSYDVPQDFLNTLPYLQYYQNITRSHMRFSEYCGYNRFDDRATWTDIEASWPFRYKILDTVSHCITGMWTKAKQIQIDQKVKGDRVLKHLVPDYNDDFPDLPTGHVMKIKEFTVSNLADYNDPNLLQSKAWGQLLHLPTLVGLKLLVTKEHYSPEYRHVICEEKYDFFQTLPSTYLTPSLASKLQVLSLFYIDFWGWFPRIDLAQVGPMPQLRILALGHYVFTHKTQTDWIASLGTGNRSGGLEELYLDDCPILYEADQYGPLTADGYPVPRTVIEGFQQHGHRSSTTTYGMRWHHVLTEWKRSMKGLKRFVMGHGNWQNANLVTKATKEREEYAHLSYDERERRFIYNSHRYFACPEPQESHIKTEVVPADKYLHGAGLLQRRAARMQYIYYSVGLCPSQWDHPYHLCSRFAKEEGWAPEDETVALDDAAYELFMEAIRDRLED